MDPHSTRATKTASIVSTRPVLKKDYVNSPPVFPDQDPDMQGVQDTATRSISETAAPGSAVGAPVAATDMGATRMEVLTYKLSGTDAALFSIDRMSGQIRVAPGKTLDYEDLNHQDHEYEVMVTATDPGGGPSRNHSDHNRHQRGRSADDHGGD